MEFFNKAKEAAEKYTGGGDSNSKKDDKKEESIFSKAMDAVDKYHVKEKAIEYAQKQVAKREEEKLQPGYVEEKDKSIVDKAKEAAEDFLAKQGDKPQQVPTPKPKEDKTETRSRSSSSSSSSSSDSEKEKKRPTGATCPAPVGADNTTLSYPSTSTGGDISGSFGRMNLENNAESYPPAGSGYSGNDRGYPSYPASSEGGSVSSSGKFESYQEYWARQDNGSDTERRITDGESTYHSGSRGQPDYNAPSSYSSSDPRYTGAGDSSYAADSRGRSDYNAPSSYSSGDPRYTGNSSYSNLNTSPAYPSRVEGNGGYYGNEREVSSYAGAANPSYSNTSERYGAAGNRDTYPSGSESGRYQSSEEYYCRARDDMNNDGRNYPNYSSGAGASGSGYSQMSSDVYGNRVVSGSSSGARMPYGSYNDSV